MNPVIGLDVAKGVSQVQAFLDKHKPYRKSFSVLHNIWHVYFQVYHENF
jgi:transposase